MERITSPMDDPTEPPWAGEESPCGNPAGHACPACRPRIATTAEQIGAPFAQVAELVSRAEEATLERLVRLAEKERDKTRGQRVASLAPGPGNRAIRRAMKRRD